MIVPNQNELADMLRFMRPAGSMAELAFKTRYLNPLGVIYDENGNGLIEIDNSPIIWSCHTDTVHDNSGFQSVSLLSAVPGKCFAMSEQNCLGADCTTGVFIMVNMIRNRVPGLYVFHHGEELGCLGARALVRERGKDLAAYKACIAFDRKGYTDIVRYQNGRRCCSDAFVDSFAGILDQNYEGSGGIYTDSAEYTGVVGECTNISVGYFSQHTQSETQDVDFALWLANRMCEIDLTKLVFKRKPGTYESEYSYSNGYGYGNEYGYGQGYSGKGLYGRELVNNTMYDVVYNHPSSVSNMLIELGFTREDVLAYCEAYNKQKDDETSEYGGL